MMESKGIISTLTNTQLESPKKKQKRKSKKERVQETDEETSDCTSIDSEKERRSKKKKKRKSRKEKERRKRREKKKNREKAQMTNVQGDSSNSNFGRDRRPYWDNQRNNYRNRSNPRDSYSSRDSSESDRSRSRGRSFSRSPSGDRFGCYACGKSHRAVECPVLSRWYRETLLWNFMKKRQYNNNRVSKEEEERMRRLYGLEEEKCKNNPARDHVSSDRVNGAGAYCKYCHVLDHPTLYCNKHCPLCDKKDAGHGWRTCTAKKEEAQRMDTELAEFLDKSYFKWKQIKNRPRMP